MSTETRTRYERHASRTVAVLIALDPPPLGLTPGGEHHVASIASEATADTPSPIARLDWNRPYVLMNHYRFTRAQWEALKREVDQAWGVFESTWPVDGEPAPIRPGARVELAELEAPKIIAHPFRVGERGRVVRLVHATVEGEPLSVERSAPTLAHVRFDGREELDVVAFDPKCLRVVDEPEAP